jgi:hypothetical protein
LSIGLFAVCTNKKIKNFFQIEKIKKFARIAVCYPLFPQLNHSLIPLMTEKPVEKPVEKPLETVFTVQKLPAS